MPTFDADIRNRIVILVQGILEQNSVSAEVTADVPAQKTSIILALDESGSMCSTDVKPNRLTVAQRGALQFVNSEPSGTQIGLVLFNVYAELAVHPTEGEAHHSAADPRTSGRGPTDAQTTGVPDAAASRAGMP